MKKIKKAYHLLFYKLVLVGSKCNKPRHRKAELEDGVFTASGWFSMLLAFIFYIIIINIENAIQKDIISDSSIFFPLTIISVIGLYSFVHYSLLYKNRWQTYIDEFKSYSKSKNVFINIIVLFVVLLIIINFGISLYIW